MASDPRYPQSICWDCANACCGCSWSRGFVPVDGWKAIQKKIKLSGGKTTPTYIVCECPRFQRDAIGYGMKWVNKQNMPLKMKGIAI